MVIQINAQLLWWLSSTQLEFSLLIGHFIDFN